VIGGGFEVDELLGELDGIDRHYGKDNRRAGRRRKNRLG
jgi:hypothetical protein